MSKTHRTSMTIGASRTSRTSGRAGRAGRASRTPRTTGRQAPWLCACAVAAAVSLAAGWPVPAWRGRHGLPLHAMYSHCRLPTVGSPLESSCSPPPPPLSRPSSHVVLHQAPGASPASTPSHLLSRRRRTRAMTAATCEHGCSARTAHGRTSQRRLRVLIYERLPAVPRAAETRGRNRRPSCPVASSAAAVTATFCCRIAPASGISR